MVRWAAFLSRLSRRPRTFRVSRASGGNKEQENARRRLFYKVHGTAIANPCEDPQVKITIAPQEKGHDVFPWILPLAKAIEIFGQEVVDEIRTLDDPTGPGPVPIRLELKWEFATHKASTTRS